MKRILTFGTFHKNVISAPLLFFLAIIDFIACSYGITTQSSKYLFDHWPLRPFGLTEDEKVNDANCKFNYTILEFIYASSIYLIFLVNVNRAYSLYNQNKASNWFDMRGTSKSVALVSSFKKHLYFYISISLYVQGFHYCIPYYNYTCSWHWFGRA